MYINSKSFDLNLDDSIAKVLSKESNFKELCSQWYKAYDKFDLDAINKLTKEIKSKERTSVLTSESSKIAKVICNITQFVNTKQDKLSNAQLEICKTI